MKYLNPYNSRYGLTPYSSRSFSTLESEFEKLFGSLPNLFDLGDAWFAEGGSQSLRPRWYESDDSYSVRIDLPGVESKEVSLEVVDNQLTLSAERKASSQEDEAKRGFSYRQSFSIPDGVDADKVSARFEDGILTVTFPKSEAIKPRRIEIK